MVTLLGLELGAYDYVIETFSLTEWEARIRCLLRRAHQRPPGACSAGGLAAASLGLEISDLSMPLSSLFNSQL